MGTGPCACGTRTAALCWPPSRGTTTPSAASPTRPAVGGRCRAARIRRFACGSCRSEARRREQPMAADRKIALVTGAGSGIGKATALALLREGYAVVLAGRRAEALERTKVDAGPAAERALAVAADVSDEASVRRLFD